MKYPILVRSLFFSLLFLVDFSHIDCSLDSWVDLNDNNQVEKFEAQRYTVFLKDQMILARGIRVGLEIINKPNWFYTLEPNGLQKFTVINQRVRLLAIETPSEFSIEDDANSSFVLTISKFLTLNFPEVKSWSIEQYTDEKITFFCVFGMVEADQSIIIKQKIGCLNQTKKVVFLETDILYN